MIRSAVLCGLLAMSVVAWAQEAPVPSGVVVTLEQAVALALQNNRLVHNAALEVDKATDRVAAARTRRLPAFDVYVLESYLLTPVDFTFEQGTFGTFPSTGPIPAKDTTIRTERQPTTLVSARVTQPLSQLYRIGLNVQLQAVAGQWPKKSYGCSGSPSCTTQTVVLRHTPNAQRTRGPRIHPEELPRARPPGRRL
jgi:outer membrane efflux protein